MTGIQHYNETYISYFVHNPKSFDWILQPIIIPFSRSTKDQLHHESIRLLTYNFLFITSKLVTHSQRQYHTDLLLNDTKILFEKLSI
jgi:hypothetical protein